MVTRVDPVSLSSLTLRPAGIAEGRLAGAPVDHSAKEISPGGFTASLATAVSDAADAGRVADARAAALAAGTHDDLHGTMIAGKQAEISLKLVAAIRNKLLDGFHELWRTSV